MKKDSKLRKCRRCGDKKPTADFVDVSGTPNPQGGYCAACHQIRVQEWAEEAKEERAATLRKLKIIYGKWWRHYCWPQEFAHDIYAERDLCPYCNGRMPPEYVGDHPELGSFKGRAHLDHMDPLAFGGEDSIRNVIYVCDECNYKKCDMLYIDWLKKLKPKQRSLCRKIYEEKHGNPPEEFKPGPATERSSGTLAWLHMDEEDVLDMFPEPCVDGPPNQSGLVLEFSFEYEEEE